MAEDQEQQPQGPQDINVSIGQAVGGMNLNSILREVKPGQTSYALNAQVENASGDGITYQNESGNLPQFSYPDGYKVIGSHLIPEQDRVVFWLANPTTGGSEIGVGGTLTGVYKTLVNQKCLNFNINWPIHKAVHKITACGTEVYWTDNFNSRRFIDLDNLPYAQSLQSTGGNPCQTITLPTIDCNKLNVQPNFSIPKIEYQDVVDGGNIVEGSYQFAIQYTNYAGDPYTSFYSVTNPLPILDPLKVGPDFNYVTGKSIKLGITAIDTTGIYDYFNVAVIKTINNITSVDLVGTYQITNASQTVTYTGTSKEGITLSINDIFEKYVFFDKADDITTVQDVLVWKGLTTNERVSYQQIANQIKLQWQNWKISSKQGGYKDALNAANIEGYMGDENYPFDMVIMLKNGYQSDRFPIPGREAMQSDLALVNNADGLTAGTTCDTPEAQPRWRVYNTASVTGFAPEFIGHENDDCYEGPYQYGEFAYTESTETYPCNTAVWGPLAGLPIRHHRFPDSSVAHHHDNQGNIYPKGVRIDAHQIYKLIENSSLTQDQKDQIASIKIVRGDRAAHKSIIAKGLLYNVGGYTKDNTNYFYPNYPFNDLRADPFIKARFDLKGGKVIASNFDNNATIGTTQTTLESVDIPDGILKTDDDQLVVVYTGIFSGDFSGTGGVGGRPGRDSSSTKSLGAFIGNNNIFGITNLVAGVGSSWTLTLTITRTSGTSLSIQGKLVVSGTTVATINQTKTITNIDLTQSINIGLTGQVFGTNVVDGDITTESELVTYIPAPDNLSRLNPFLQGFSTDDSKNRFTFHSPDTSFFQPSLGSTLKFESVEYGTARSHFVQVKDHSKYKFPSLGSFLTSLAIGVVIGFASATVGVSDQVFDGAAAFTAFSTFNDIIDKLIPRKNFAYQFNSLGNYQNSTIIPNDNGNKVRRLDIAAYLTSGMNGVGDDLTINNYQREGSVYLRATQGVPFPDVYPAVPVDTSRYTLSQVGCDTGFYNNPISAYYGSIKNEVLDQYGEIYSYPTVDTGFSLSIDMQTPLDPNSQQFYSIFGGDTFINRFAFKRKLPFFLDNRVGFPDDSDVFYDELGNIGAPAFWFSTDVQKGSGGFQGIGQLFGVKVNSFDCKDGSFFYDSGKFYLFAYGIPYFYVESQVNVDYRQASNAKEGEFFPHVSADVPDDWLQEINVPIAQDNVYNYNKSFSKQNAENVFTTLPTNFVPNQLCTQVYPNKAIWSDIQADPVYYKKNSWLIYKPTSYKDFPLNYGKLISIDGIENREVIARFENRTVSYNTMLTMNASSPNAVYLGSPELFSQPPVDLSDTDGGYAGTQHKMFIKTEHGHISIDAKRGQIMVIPATSPYYQRRQLRDLAGLEFGLKEFFCENLEFRILKTFPNYPIDNAFNGVGLHGVYDSKYNRLIITKFDWEVTNPSLTYNATLNKFFDGTTEIALGDPSYFCSRSFALSFSFLTNSWISFHSYLPNFYVTGPSYFFSGINYPQASFWIHNRTYTLFNNFYGTTAPYILEYPFAYKVQDEIVQNIKDYTKVLRYLSDNDYQSFVEVNDIFFNKAILYNGQQSSGILNLIPKPKSNMAAYMSYPKYNLDSKDILVTKSNSFYNYNTFWDIVLDKSVPFFVRDCASLSFDKKLISTNLGYTNRAFKKAPLMAKDLRVRHILDNTSDYKLISQFILAPSQVSYK